MTNVLLQSHELPPFSRITIDDIESALDALLAQNRERIAQLTKGAELATWDGFVEVMEEMDDVLGQMWSPVSHLNGVKNSDELRAVIERCLPKFSEYSTELGQNPQLFARYQQLRDGAEYQKLSDAQRKVIDNAIRDFRLSGIDLPDDAKKRFGDIKKRLSELSNKFSNNVLDATQGWFKHFATADLLPGLPATALNSAAGAAKTKGLEGFVITLDFPLYFPLLTYCDDRALREEFYTANVTRASELGPNAGKWDNSALMVEILALRNEVAKLLGFDSYAERSLATKMATSTDQVIGFLRDLAKQSKQVAQQDFDELQQSSMVLRNCSHGTLAITAKNCGRHATRFPTKSCGRIFRSILRSVACLPSCKSCTTLNFAKSKTLTPIMPTPDCSKLSKAANLSRAFMSIFLRVPASAVAPGWQIAAFAAKKLTARCNCRRHF